MMDALLDITQMTAGRLELRRQKLDLVAVVNDAANSLGPAAFHSPPVSPPLTR
jgi:K+-sensing histidine kinase KdpD